MCFVVFFFFKQKTAYEMLRSLVGSEMCIRDSVMEVSHRSKQFDALLVETVDLLRKVMEIPDNYKTVSYTHLTLPTIYSV